MIECVGRGQGNIEGSKDGGTELVKQEDVLHTFNSNDSLF